MLKKYPLDYEELTDKLKERYTDFKANNAYHQHRKPLEKQERLCRVRFLDPSNPKGIKKKFYSTEIIKEFDKFYTKK